MRSNRPQPLFFATPADFRAWLDSHHAEATELWVGFHKKGSGRPSLTWPESVDEALCFGWIDGLRKSVDARSYMIRFTPRKAGSNWSAINVAKMAELATAGRVRPAGQAAFAARSSEKTGIYSYENRKNARLDDALLRRFRAQPRAWRYFQAQPAWYRGTATWWVVSAKKEETRLRRLEKLIAASARSEPIAELRRPGKSGQKA
jgi:uncharacterized protein YdeI (YjbR/CyaY-like superfamily)